MVSEAKQSVTAPWATRMSPVVLFNARGRQPPHADAAGVIGARFPRALALRLRIGIGAVLLLAMASCAPEKPVPAKEVVARIGLDLPPGAKIEFSKYLPGGMDDAAMLMLVLPEADWKSLLLRVEKQAAKQHTLRKTITSPFLPTTWDGLRLMPPTSSRRNCDGVRAASRRSIWS